MNLIAAQKTAIDAARAAGQVMRANWHRPKFVKEVELHDIKLELDVRCQKLIEKILRAAFPLIPLLGEEGDCGEVDSEYRWMVDPIDGTVNYFFGLPQAAVSIALQRRDEFCVTRDEINVPHHMRNPVKCHSSHVTLLGVIFDPFADELWTAVRGGATRLKGKTVRVSRRSHLGDAAIAMGFSKSKTDLEKTLPHLTRLARRTRKIRILGSAALALAYVASGRLDAYLERAINVWDIAAGALMVECSSGEMFLKPLPGGRFRMCADNGRLRRKLHVDGLLK